MAQLMKPGLRLGIAIVFLWTIASCYTAPIASSGEMAILAHQNQLDFRADGLQQLNGSEGTQSLTAEEAVELALKSDSGLRVRRAFLSRAKSRVSAAGELRNPEIRYSQEKLEDFMGDETRLDIEFRLRPPRPGELGAREEIARSEVRSAKARLDMAQERVAYKVRSLFREIGFLGIELGAVRNSIEIRERLVELTKTRVKEGLATKMDLALVEVTHYESLQDRQELESELENLRRELSHRVGLPTGTKLQLKGTETNKVNLASLPSVEDLVRRALNSREELEVAASRIRAADAELFIEKLEWVPWISHIRVGYEMEPASAKRNAMTAGIAFELPLLSLNLGDIEAAEAETVLRQTEFDRQVQDIASSVREQYRRVKTAAQKAQTLEQGAKLAVDRGAIAARMAMEAGQVDIRGLTLVEERRASVHRKWLRALRSYNQELTKLMDAVGGDLH